MGSQARTEELEDEVAIDNVISAGPEVRRLRMFHALAYRNFRLFVVGQLISLAGTWMQMVAQQWLVFSITKSAAWLGIVSGASALPYAAFSVLGGHTADRFPRRTILIVTQATAMILAAALGLLASGRWIPLQAWHIALMAALMGVVSAFNMPAQQAFVPEMVESGEALGNAIALNSLMFNTARFLGPIFAGAMLVKFGPAACFGLNAASYIAVIASLFMMRIRYEAPLHGRQSVWEGFNFIRSQRSILRTIVLVGVAGMTLWSISTLYPVLAAHFGHGAAGFSVIMSVNGVGAALGGLFVAAFGHRFARRYLVYSAPLLCCAGFLALTWSPNFQTALGCLFVSGFAMIIFGVSAQTKVQGDVSNALRGRVMAVYSLVFSALMPLGGLLIGMLAEHTGTMNAIRLNVSACILVTVALFVWSQKDVASRAQTNSGTLPQATPI